MVEGESLTVNPRKEDNFEDVKIKRGKVDSLSLYEVTESELGDLETGGQDNLFLNFAILLLTAAIAFLISLLTVEMPSTQVFCIFVIITVIGFIGGAILMLLWNRSRKSKKAIIQGIKDRMPKENGTDLNAEQIDAVQKT